MEGAPGVTKNELFYPIQDLQYARNIEQVKNVILNEAKDKDPSVSDLDSLDLATEKELNAMMDENEEEDWEKIDGKLENASDDKIYKTTVGAMPYTFCSRSY